MKNKSYLFLLLFIMGTRAWAQSDYVADDAGKTTGAVWTEIGATKVLPYNLSLGLDAGFRTNEWFNAADRFDVGLGLGWKPTKHWKFGVGYTFLMKHSPQETAHKNTQEIEFKYRNTSTGEYTSSDVFRGAPTYSEDGSTFRYQGYNNEYKNYTRVTESFWRPKHRLSVDAAYTYKLWKTLRVTLRERYQATFVPSKTANRTRTGTKTSVKYRDPDDDDLTEEEKSALAAGDMTAWSKLTYDDEDTETEDAAADTVKVKSSKTMHTLRSRLTFEIDRKGWDFTPYAYVELFNDLASSFHTDKVRCSVGVEYSLSPRHRLQLGYIFNHEKDDDGDQNIHAVSVGYRFKF